MVNLKHRVCQFLERHWTTLILAWLFTVGSELIWLSIVLHDLAPVWFVVLHDISVALVVAGILGLTIDRWLKRALAKDAFEASMGYALAPEMKNTLRWVYGHTRLCKSHRQRIELLPLPGG